MMYISCLFFFSSRRRHTRCALVTEFRRVLFRSDVSSAALLDMVSTGMGATIVAKSARLARPGVVYRPISGAHSSITIQALWPRSYRNPPRHRLLTHLRKQIKEARKDLTDLQSVVKGNSVLVRVILGVKRLIIIINNR